ncbi:MAG: conjugal transfer protein TraG N-terminal domain-containing protein, partial [Chromatiaceae bacterium]
FGPKVSVAIEDAYSGAVRVVDNVPIGPATVGSIMSNVGYGITRLFEQAFSTPAMTDYGFADALQTLMGVRKATLSRLALGGANSPTTNADVERSFVNYVADCTLADVDTGRRSIDDILNTASWETLKSDSDVYTTQLWVGGDPKLLPCNEAWVALSDYTTVEFLPALLANLQAQMRLAAPGDVASKVQTALDEIAGAGVDAQNYMVMAAVLPFFEKGIVQTHADLGQWGLAAMVEQAQQQRNTQWATEQTLFTRIVRPMMTFFEGFLYAIAPLMAFAVALGPVGIAMVGKYLLFGLWIQLWLPIMAVINLYLHMAIARDLAALQGAGHLDVPSMFSLYKLDFLLQDYLATGGMLAASTPAISLMLIYGSAITATHLAGRLQGGDYVDEKVAAPDVVRSAPALTMSPIQTNAPLTGTVTSGAESVLPRFNIGQEIQSSVTSTSAALAQSSAVFQRGLSSVAASSAARSGQSFDSRAMAWSYESSGSETDKALLSEGESLARKYSQSEITSQQMAGLVSSGLAAAASRGKNEQGEESKRQIGGNIRAELQSKYGVDGQFSDQIADDIARRVTSDQEFSARLAEGVKADVGSGTRNVFT